tara:strand:- start:32 stop:349 length:318 start_codon:yes stop_codon:yes gene_type:complete
MALKKADPLKTKKNLKCERKKRNKISLDNKTYYFHKIVWEDIVGDSTIASADEFNKMKTAIIISFAYIFKKENGYLYTFSSYSDDGYFGDRNIIPLGCVKSINKH